MVDRVRIGNVEMIVVADVVPPPFERSQFFPDIPAEAWAPYAREHLNPDGTFQTNFCAWVLRSPAGVVLVDTGLGPGPHRRFAGSEGRLMAKLAENGVRMEEVRNIIITHLHGDHIGWNVTYDGRKPRATFPRARYLVPKGDWDYFTRGDVLPNQKPVATSVVPLMGLGALDLVEGERTVTREVTVVPTPGHTPGHVSVVVTSGGEKAMIVGDLFHSAVQVTEVEWCAAADMDKETARKSRRQALERAERERFVVGAGHLPMGKNIGRVVRLQGKRYWQAL